MVEVKRNGRIRMCLEMESAGLTDGLFMRGTREREGSKGGFRGQATDDRCCDLRDEEAGGTGVQQEAEGTRSSTCGQARRDET